jgi:hypothetical protein
MRAVQITRFGGPEVLDAVAALRPSCVLDEVLGDETEGGAVSELRDPVRVQHGV